jgi:hypothetical protein
LVKNKKGDEMDYSNESKIEKGEIKVDPRHTARRIRTAIQGNVIRALVELIRNSDDSYTRLESEGKPAKGVISIGYKKKGYDCEFTIRDFAEGMSIEEAREGLTKYGSATSGQKEGKKVSGFFGQGAKDALASMKDGKICTFKGGMFVECKLYIEDGKPTYELRGPIPADDGPRLGHGIPRNGTVAYFKSSLKLGVKTPQFDTVHEELANNYLLRKIMTNSKREIKLLDKNSRELREVRYRLPRGQKILSEDFSINYKNYGDFPIHISIFRAENELTQAGDDRQGGLLVTDEAGAVLDISLFKFDNEPLASKFFGEVSIGGFREKLLRREEPVLSEERNGLNKRHVFCMALIEEVEKRLEAKINEERARKQKEQHRIGAKEYYKFKKAFDFLNEIAEQEVLETINLGDKRDKEVEVPPNGMYLYPPFARITVGKHYSFELRADTNKVPYGSLIKVKGSSKIQVISPEVKISESDGKGIVRKFVTVKGLEPNIEGKISAKFRDIFTEAKIYVVPEEEFLLTEGLVFQPQSITLHPNKTREVYLLVNLEKINSGSKVKIASDNSAVKVSQPEVTVSAVNVINNIAKFKLSVWGEGVGQHAIVTAGCGINIAMLDVSIKTKEEKPREGRKGMFNEPEFNYDPGPLQRASYSAETGKVIIYVNFPTVKHYLGRSLEYQNTLPAQVFTADIVAEKCFYEIAKKKVDSSASLIRAEARLDKIQKETYVLSKKYGEKVHEILVDQDMLKESRVILPIS